MKKKTVQFFMCARLSQRLKTKMFEFFFFDAISFEKKKVDFEKPWRLTLQLPKIAHFSYFSQLCNPKKISYFILFL